MTGETRIHGRGGRAFTRRATLAAFGVAAVMLVFATCVSQDPTAPEGSIITMSANPQTVVSQGGLPGRTNVTATLRGKNGTRLPDQEITFSTTSGVLTPPAQTPIITNSQGRASSFLDTASTATVTATSGAITGTTSVNVTSGNLSQLSLDVQPGDLSACTDTVDLTVDALDPNGNGVAGVLIIFTTSVPGGRNELKGTISPTQPRTNSSGTATATFTPTLNFCNSNCDSNAQPVPPNGGACAIQFVAKDISGAIVSSPVQLTESVP